MCVYVQDSEGDYLDRSLMIGFVLPLSLCMIFVVADVTREVTSLKRIRDRHDDQRVALEIVIIFRSPSILSV